MARYNQNWDDLGRSIQDIVDRAVNSHDYQKLDQTVRQVIEKAVDVGGEAVRKARESAARPAPRTVEAEPVRRTVEAEVEKELPVLYGRTSGKTAVGIVKTAGGGVLSFGSLVILLLSGILKLVTGAPMMSVSLVMTLLGTAGGIGLMCSGIADLNWVGRFKTYRKILGGKTYCTLEKLARSVGKSVKFVRKEVRQMIHSGLFLEGHLDQEETSLITSDETYRHYEQSRRQLEERQRLEAEARNREVSNPRDARVQEVLDKGSAFIAEIRRCNDAIPGEEISEKISRMETVVQRIFQRAEEHPEIVPDLKKMMDYYLPMTVKLLDAYADMDAQPVQGETIQTSKREIEATLDTLTLAFEKLLDDLFRDTAMDVSSDISVLHTLLAQEGLTEDEFSKMKKRQNT